MIVLSPVPALIGIAIIGVVLIIVGLVKKNTRTAGWGGILLGLSVFATPVLFFMHEASDTWSTFTPSAGEIGLLGILAFVGGMLTALGLRNILADKSKPRTSSS